MTTLDWSNIEDRKYETGLDRGVLYVENSPGVSWQGLISLSDSPSGGDVTGYYIDGVKYLMTAAATEYAATLNAYSSPPEFDACEGYAIRSGLTLVDQPKKMFGLSYRTLTGSALVERLGYKVHLVYNAMIGNTSRDYQSLGDSVNPLSLSWPISARPIFLPGVRPTAHLIIDSLATDPEALDALFEIIYGTDSTDPRLPTVLELITIFDFTVTPPPEVEYIFDGGSPDGTLDGIDSGII